VVINAADEHTALIFRVDYYNGDGHNMFLWYKGDHCAGYMVSETRKQEYQIYHELLLLFDGKPPGTKMLISSTYSNIGE
jgi:hypothetical protein